jgi:hypothetical protein
MTMKTKLSAIAICLMIFSFLVGCQSVAQERNEEAVKEANKEGAEAGAIVPSRVAKERPITNALQSIPGEVPAGKLKGALSGGIIGTYHHETFRPGPGTIGAYNYQDSQGTVLHVEEAFTQLPIVHPGDTIDLSMRYAVLSPSHSVPIRITELREIKLDNRIVGRIAVDVSRSDGTYTSVVAVSIPPQAPMGEYWVIDTIRSGEVHDMQEMSFVVAPLHRPLGNLPGGQ